MGKHYAILAGTCAAAASLFGKLSGIPLLQEYLLVRIASFGLMILCNLNVWTLFVKACQASDSSLLPTVISSTTNFVLSGLVGYLFFEEVISIIWWTGMGLLIVGLLMIISDENLTTNTDKETVINKNK